MTKVFMDGADPIVIRDLDGRFLDMNCETERAFGWTRAELIGKETNEFLPPEWRDFADAVLKRLQAGETVRNSEAVVRTKSGQLIPILATAFLLTDESDRPVAIASMIKDVTQLKRTSERLEHRNRELKQFVTTVSHDLAAPLRAISHFAESLAVRARDQSDVQAGEDLQSILDSAANMQQLIDDLLEYSRLDSQAKSLQDVDCDQALARAVANLHAAIQECDARVTSDPLPRVMGYAPQMTQLFQNLVGNAIKFRGAQPPRVHVSADPLGSGWRFSVRDNGIGIDAEHFDKIFDVFHRLHSRDEIPGTGVGLASCKVIVERLGGRIWVESQPGGGCVFYFTVPNASPIPAESPGSTP
jgi:PAS domain S-box-containing protein